MKFAIVFIMAIMAESGGKSLPPEDARCLGCHQRVSLFPADTLGGGYSVPLTQTSYLSGDHRSLSCTACHGSSILTVPHHPIPMRETSSCFECHSAELSSIGAESINDFVASNERDVHKMLLGPGFSCSACHEPHSSSLFSMPSYPASNHPCLKCHEQKEVTRTHLWLPSFALHLRSITCTACHTPSGSSGQTHFVLPRDSSLKTCRECHSRKRAAGNFRSIENGWNSRLVPGWRAHIRIELIFLSFCALVIVTHLAFRILSKQRNPTQVVCWGPTAKLRTLAIGCLYVTGAAIYFGDGRALTFLSRLHLIAGVVMIAACAGRALLEKRKTRSVLRTILEARTLFLITLLATGTLLLAPAVTPILDLCVPLLRLIHRVAAPLFLLWLILATSKR